MIHSKQFGHTSKYTYTILGLYFIGLALDTLKDGVCETFKSDDGL